MSEGIDIAGKYAEQRLVQEYFRERCASSGSDEERLSELREAIEIIQGARPS